MRRGGAIHQRTRRFTERAAEFIHEHLGRRIVEHALHAAQRLQDQLARLLDVVAVADADVVFHAPLVEGGVDRHGVGEELAIRDHDAPAIVGADHRGAGLDVLHLALEVAHLDLVADAERLVPKQQDAGEEVLQDVAKGEADGDGGDAEKLHELRRLEGRQRDDQRDEQTEKDDAALREPAEHEADILVALAPRS